MAVTPPPAVDVLPTAPSTSSPTTFAALADAFIAALATLRTQLIALAGNVFGNAVDASSSASSASANAAAAAASATATTSTAPLWASGAYTLGAIVRSPINFVTYCCKVAGAGLTDPSIDTVNWVVGVNDIDMQNQIVSAVKYALTQSGVANNSINALKNINQQEGTVTFQNYGVVYGCAMTNNAAGNRSVALALGVCFLEGRKYYTPANALAAIVPDNGGVSSAVVYAYLYLVAGIPTLAISAIGAAVPAGSVVLYSLTIPAGNTLATDSNLAGVTITDIRRIESNFPMSLDAPSSISVSIAVLSDIDYQLTFDVVSYTGAPVSGESILVYSRATNGFTVQLISASDDVIVRWKLSKLNN